MTPPQHPFAILSGTLANGPERPGEVQPLRQLPERDAVKAWRRRIAVKAAGIYLVALAPLVAVAVFSDQMNVTAAAVLPVGAALISLISAVTPPWVGELLWHLAGATVAGIYGYSIAAGGVAWQPVVAVVVALVAAFVVLRLAQDARMARAERVLLAQAAAHWARQYKDEVEDWAYEHEGPLAPVVVPERHVRRVLMLALRDGRLRLGDAPHI